MANILEGNVMTAVKRKGRQKRAAVQEAHILSMEQKVLEKVLTYVIAASTVDLATLSAVRLTCKQLRGIADSPKLWNQRHAVTGRGAIDFCSFKFMALKCTGTEGTCVKVVNKGTGEEYALKKSRPFPNDDGVPYYLVRELSTLKALVHANIAPLLGVSLQQGRRPWLYTLFPFVQHTLQEVLSVLPSSDANGHVQQPRGLPHMHVQRLAAQLLQAVRHCHAHGVLHRNIKPKHILIRLRGSHESAAAVPAGSSTPRTHRRCPESAPAGFELDGAELLLSDFALLRTVAQPRKTYTGDMFSLWYRPPEVLMGVRAYSEAADMWSVGCVVAEMLTGAQLFQGTSQIDQLFQIFSKLGTPTPESWPAFTSTPYYTECKFPRWEQRRQGLGAHVRAATSAQLDLLGRCLQCCPDRRPSAAQLLSHPALQNSAIVQAELSAPPKSLCTRSPELPVTLSWAAPELGRDRFRAYTEARALRWEQLHAMRAQSERCALDEQRRATDTREVASQQRGHTIDAARLKSLPCYQLLVAAMREVVELRAADNYSPACLHRAVGLLDRYATAVAPCPFLPLGDLAEEDFEAWASFPSVPTAGTDTVLESVHNAARGTPLWCAKSKRLENPCTVALVTPLPQGPTADTGAPAGQTATQSTSSPLLSAEECRSGLRGLGLSQSAAVDLLALAACCLQLASKYEDVMYLELTELQRLAAACLEGRLRQRAGISTPASDHEDAAPHPASQFARLSQQPASLHVLLAACADVCPGRVLALEEQVLRALDFQLHRATTRDFAGLLQEECRGLEEALQQAGKEPVSWLDYNVSAVTLPRASVPRPCSVANCLREVLGGLITSHALANAAMVAYPPSLVAASTVWLCGQLSLLLSNPALWEQQGAVEERAAWQARWEGRVGAAERGREAALRGWSGYAPSALAQCMEAIWAELQNYARSAEPESVWVVGPSGEEAPLRGVLLGADADCVLGPLRHGTLAEATIT